VSTLTLTSTNAIETIWGPGFAKPPIPDEIASTESLTGDDSLVFWLGMRATVEANYSKFIEP
jgi:hypothetical protein